MRATHVMSLQPGPFEKIKSGLKTVEVRLYDEKRQAIKMGDDIEFTLTSDENQKLRVKVIGLQRFHTFLDVFHAVSPMAIGAKSAEDWKEMYKYYTEEQERRYGVLAINVDLIN